MQTTIYIRKENENRWKQITDKSAWVNAYLEKNPPNSVVIKENLEPNNIPESVHAAATSRNVESTPPKTSIVNIPAYTCKNGHLANERGKCLQKGCKYS